MLTAYVWAAGPEFKAQRFLQHEGEGTLRLTKVMKSGREVPGPAEWESRKFELPNDVPTDEAIRKLWPYFGSLIDDAKRMGASEIFLQFVGRFVDRDGNGLYLSPDVMRALAERGVSVDYDIVKTARAA